MSPFRKKGHTRLFSDNCKTKVIILSRHFMLTESKELSKEASKGHPLIKNQCLFVFGNGSLVFGKVPR